MGLATLLAVPVWGGRRERRAHDAWLAARCADAPATTLHLPTGWLAPGEGPPIPGDAHRIVVSEDGLNFDGLTLSDAALEAAISARQTSAILLVVPGSLASERWGPALTTIRKVAPGAVLRAAVEATRAPTPSAPAPDLVRRLHQARSAVREQVRDPFAQLAAIDGMAAQIALPDQVCPLLPPILREPLPAERSCPARVADVTTALAGCGLNGEARARAVTAVGESWAPTDEAALATVEVEPDRPLPERSSTWAAWISGQSARAANK